jgi:DNA-binding LacI/PurR family transcriptional regulator
VLKALRSAGRRVPEDVSVAGFDDQRMSAYLDPPLTTVRAPTAQVGQEAARQLIRLIQAQPVPAQKTLLPVEIILRRSCGCQE